MPIFDAIVSSILPMICTLWCLSTMAKLDSSQRPELLIFANLFILSAAQTLSYLTGAINQELMFNFAHCYLLALYWLFANLIVYVYFLGQNSSPKIFWIYIAPLAFNLLHLTGYTTNGFSMEQGTPMHIDGPLSAWGDYYMIAAIVIAGALIQRNLKALDSQQWVSKNLILLLAFVPLALFSLIVQLLSMTSYAISLVIVGPLITLYVLMVFTYLTRPMVMNVAMGIDLVLGRLSLISKIAVTEYTPENLKELKGDLDRQGIAEALNQSDGNIYKAADYLGVDHSTVRKKIKLLNVPLKT